MLLAVEVVVAVGVGVEVEEEPKVGEADVCTHERRIATPAPPGIAGPPAPTRRIDDDVTFRLAFTNEEPPPPPQELAE